MNNIIQLTQTNGNPIYVNVLQIICYSSRVMGTGRFTLINCPQFDINVQETPSEITKRIHSLILK